MGLLESARGVLWARKRRPEHVRYVVALAHERFQPPELLRQARESEEAGFDGVCCSDHLEPWWDPEGLSPPLVGTRGSGSARSQTRPVASRSAPPSPG